MDPQIIFNALIAICGVAGGAMLKSIYDAIQDLRKSDGEIHERINTMPNVYLRRDDFMAFGNRVEAALIRIEAKIDNKVDRNEISR